MKTSKMSARRLSGGFTLVEMMVSTGIGAVVIAGMLSLFISFIRSYNATTLMRNTSAGASTVLERMVYGVGTNAGLREAQSNSVVVTYPSGGWQIAYTNLICLYKTNTFSIIWSNSTDQSSKTICTNVISSTLTNLGSGCRISVSISESAGGRRFTNSMTSFAQYRN